MSATRPPSCSSSSGCPTPPRPRSRQTRATFRAARRWTRRQAFASAAGDCPPESSLEPQHRLADSRAVELYFADAASMNDDNPVGYLEKLVEVGREHHDRHAGVACGPQLF